MWTQALNVEKRRLYDILNIFEAFNAVTKKAKNQYIWKGVGCIYDGLDKIQAKCNALKIQNPNYSDNDASKILYTDLLMKMYKCETQKSLGLLCESFICMFIMYKKVLTLDEAASKISELSLISSQLKTKVRRLYDIANVLTIMKIIKKTFLRNGKAAFEWIGKSGFEQFISEIEGDENIIKIEPPIVDTHDGCNILRRTLNESSEETSEFDARKRSSNDFVDNNSLKICMENDQIQEIIAKLSNGVNPATIQLLEAIVKILKERVGKTG